MTNRSYGETFVTIPLVDPFLMVVRVQYQYNPALDRLSAARVAYPDSGKRARRLLDQRWEADLSSSAEFVRCVDDDRSLKSLKVQGTRIESATAGSRVA